MKEEKIFDKINEIAEYGRFREEIELPGNKGKIVIQSLSTGDIEKAKEKTKYQGVLNDFEQEFDKWLLAKSIVSINGMDWEKAIREELQTEDEDKVWEKGKELLSTWNTSLVNYLLEIYVLKMQEYQDEVNDLKKKYLQPSPETNIE